MLASFIAYLVILLVVAFLAFRHSRPGAEDYLVSSRDHGPWVSALSASASSESGWVMLGLVGAAYTSGISCFWLLPGCLAGYLFNWLVLGPRLQKFSSDHRCCSIPDVLAARFPDAHPGLRLAIRSVAVVLVVACMGAYLVAGLTATGKALEAMLGWHYGVGVALGTGVVVGYTAIGGLRAVSWTDVLQAVLMLTALLILPVLVLHRAASGSTSVMDAIRSSDPALLDWRGGASGMGILGFVIGWVGIGLGYPGQLQVLKRFLSARGQAVFRGAPWIAIAWSQAVFTGAILLGLGARVVYPDLADPEQALPIAATDILPGVLAGLVLAAVFSAICSTADSQLLEVAGAVVHDAMPNRLVRWNETIASRVTVIVFGLLAGLFALTSSRVIFTMVLYTWAALGASFGTTVTFALLWKRTTALGALLGLLVGPVTVVIWRSVLGWNDFLYELVPAFGLSAAAIVIGSLLTAPVRETVNAPTAVEVP